MAIAQQGLTLEEFLKLPEQEPALEFEEGRIVQKAWPNGKHSALQYAICELVNRFAEPGRLALAFPELRATFGGRSPVPDVAVYRWERIPVGEAGRIANDFREPPDIAVEIISPEQSVNALVGRCLWYVDQGVCVALLVDPADQSVLVFFPGQQPRVLYGAEPIDLSDVLPGFELRVQDLFAALSLR